MSVQLTDKAIALGDGIILSFTKWSPDREANPAYADWEDVDPFGALVTCEHGNGREIAFKNDTPHDDDILPFLERLTIVSLEPLTIEEKIILHHVDNEEINDECRHEGYVTEGKWVQT